MPRGSVAAWAIWWGNSPEHIAGIIRSPAAISFALLLASPAFFLLSIWIYFSPMSKLFSKFLGFFSSRTLAGVDKFGNRYFTRIEEVDGIMKEKRWVIFKDEPDSTSIPVEWICWLNGQRKKAPTQEEMAELEARRALIKENVALLKMKEEEERKSHVRQTKTIGKGGAPDLKSFIQQFPDVSSALQTEERSDVKDASNRDQRSSEPSGSGTNYKPGTWQPPS